MSMKQVLVDNLTASLPCPASVALGPNHLVWWDSGNAVINKASNRADKGSLALNQIDFRSIFAGVLVEQRLSTETSTGNDSRRLVVLDGVFDAPCSSSTFEVNDLVGIDRSSTPANYDNQVIKVSNPALAIGTVVRREPSAVTSVRCRLTSSVFFNLPSMANRALGVQGQGVTVLTDAAQTLTVGSNPILSMVPTAARNVTLPAEAQSLGLEFLFTNNSAGAFSVTFKASDGATAIKGNGVVPQNKTGLFWCDGTNWNGLVSA